jgi:hypothetical protein
MKKTLSAFGTASESLAALLKEGRKLDVDDQIFIENHMLIVQLAYCMWKYHHPEKRSTESGRSVPALPLTPGNSQRLGVQQGRGRDGSHGGAV